MFVFLSFISLLFMNTTTISPKEGVIKDKPLPTNGMLMIPSINLNREFVASKNVDKNIIVIEKSTYPNSNNSVLILAAHSGPGKYAFFNYLYKIKKKDLAYVVFNNVKYSYELVDKYLIKKDGTASIYKYKNARTLVLITCANNYKDKQMIYIFKGINN